MTPTARIGRDAVENGDALQGLGERLGGGAAKGVIGGRGWYGRRVKRRRFVAVWRSVVNAAGAFTQGRARRDATGSIQIGLSLEPPGNPAAQCSL